MSIIKNEIPILEYDLDSKEILRPDLNMENVCLPEKCVYAFLGGTIDSFAEKHGAVCVNVLHTITKNYPIYEVMYRGQRITLCQAPLGASAAVQNLDSLIACGVKKIVCAGSCGALQDYPENLFLIPVHALRDEGTSYHYLPPSRYVELDSEIINVMESVLKREQISYSECTTWTTDGFFRETEDMVAYRKREGCDVVEMECAALAACARKRGVQFGQLLFTADTLADPSRYNARDWGASSLEIALSLLFEIVVEMWFANYDLNTCFAITTKLALVEGVAAGVDIITVSAFERDGCQSITPYQGRKIGTAIISETVDYLRINGKTAIRLAIDKGNPQSSHFWKKNHFKVISEADVNGWPKLVAERKLRKWECR